VLPCNPGNCSTTSTPEEEMMTLLIIILVALIIWAVLDWSTFAPTIKGVTPWLADGTKASASTVRTWRKDIATYHVENPAATAEEIHTALNTNVVDTAKWNRDAKAGFVKLAKVLKEAKAKAMAEAISSIPKS